MEVHKGNITTWCKGASTLALRVFITKQLDMFKDDSKKEHLVMAEIGVIELEERGQNCDSIYQGLDPCLF